MPSYAATGRLLDLLREDYLMSSSNPILNYFAFSHLPERLQEVSRPVAQLAEQIDTKLPDGPEKSAGLRKLLEAKDCFVRAALPLLILGFVCLAGCSRSAPDVPRAQATAIALCAWSGVDAGDVAPTPKPDDGVCPDCKGTGRVGDGRVSQTCLACDGTGRITRGKTPIHEQPDPDGQVPVKPTNFSPQCDRESCRCDVCACDGDRQCPYEYGAGRRLADDRSWGLLVLQDDLTAGDVQRAEAEQLVIVHPWPGYHSPERAVAYLRRDGQLYPETPAKGEQVRCEGGHCSISAGSCSSGSCGVGVRSGGIYVPRTAAPRRARRGQ